MAATVKASEGERKGGRVTSETLEEWRPVVPSWSQGGATLYHIDPKRTDLADEFRRNPFGPHSAELQKVLQILRWGPTAGKEILVCTVPYREWVIALIPERRGDKVTLEHQHPYHSVAEGLFAVFARRWQRHTGSALALEWSTS